MTTAEQLGMILPIGADFINEGDDAISNNARKVAEAYDVLMAEIAKTTWWRGAVAIPATSPAELDVLPPAAYAVASGGSATALGLPVPAGGVFEAFDVAGTRLHRFTPTVTAYAGQIWHNVRAGGVWDGWERVDPGARPWWRGATAAPATSPAQLDALPPAAYSISSGGAATAVGLPVPAGGVFEAFDVSTTGTRLHRFTPTVTAYAGQIWHNVRAGGVWDGWERVDVGAVKFPATLSTKSGFKNAGIPFTLPDNNATESVAADTLRFPFRIGATGQRARLHFRNWNWATGTTHAGAVAVGGLWAGARSGSTGNFAAAPTRLLEQFVSPADGSEYVSEWFPMPLDLTQESLFSLPFTTAVGQLNARVQGSVYRTGSAADGATVAPAGAVKGTLSPFDIWLELEVPAETPIVGAFGDSNSLGHGTDPVYGAYIQQYARARGAVPYLLAQSGSSTVSWSDAGAIRWKHWANVASPDVVVDFLGQNDLVEGVTLAQMKTKFAEHVANVMGIVSPNVVAATITPANNKSAAVNTVRRDYNSWLKTKPHGVKDTFDFSAAVSDDDATIRAADSAGDGLHMNMVGHANMASKLLERPISPLLSKTAMRVDNTAGERVFVSDGTTEKMVKGDTGWRNVSSLVQLTTTGTVLVLLRRVDERVYLSVENMNVSVAPPVHSTILAVPPGFIPYPVMKYGPQYEITSNLYSAGADIVCGSMATGNRRFQIVFPTKDAWPTSLPGTPA